MKQIAKLSNPGNKEQDEGFFYRKVGKKSCDTVLLKGQFKEIFDL